MGRNDLPRLSPDKNTQDPRLMRQSDGSAPLVFLNGASDYQKKLGVKVIETPPPILFDGSNPVVDDSIRQELLNYDIPNMYLHPAVYIHDDGQWHENYWHMTFTEEFDCWDRTNSTYDPEPMTLDGEAYEVYTYSLDETIINNTPSENRLLFKMGGTTEGLVICHQKLFALFAGNGDTGAWVQPISEY